jgi:NAD-dependent dihydropyrimidine dehydrogenase PreA subunit
VPKRLIDMAVNVDKEKCTACGACEEACPVEAIKVDETAEIDEENCIDCGTCVDECPAEAISQ